MSMQDPLSDMLTRIRNGQLATKAIVSMPGSSLKRAVAIVLKEEGYISDFISDDDGGRGSLDIHLKYFDDKPVISAISRISRPGLRQYSNAKKLPKVRGGLGIAIVSTSKGLMTGKQASRENVGGEILCYIY